MNINNSFIFAVILTVVVIVTILILIKMLHLVFRKISIGLIDFFAFLLLYFQCLVLD
jgi:hypothetical protein